MKTHFQNIYSTDDVLEATKIAQLESNVYIPNLDDPIRGEEIHEALKECKKGGYDFSITVLQKLVMNLLPMLTMLFNYMFFTSYPMKFALSLLFAIPKLGNLRLSSNFRGIQMLPSLSVLYDRVITRRLLRWLGVYIHDEQTGFTRRKSTITQSFTLRLLIEMAKKLNITLYIGCFDIQKAFDKVSRFLLFQKLIKCGIGSVMLNALKLVYLSTSCILNVDGNCATAFNTSCGIRQGAPSSSLLFIIFINDLIDYVRYRCVSEPLIEAMHVLLHADDTLIVSTSRNSFIHKCNVMLEYFEENKLKLNMKKSGYMFINGKEDDVKCSVQLNNGLLSYKNRIVYLGLIFTDSGKIKEDIQANINEKRGNITTKYTNFNAKHYLAPLKVKLNVLNACCLSSLCYGSEIWGDNDSNDLETIYRIGIKTALSIRQSTCNEIVYVESGMYPIKSLIKKQQLKFWLSLNENLVVTSNLYKLLEEAKRIRLPFINYYESLATSYNTPENCERFFREEYLQKMKEKFNAEYVKDPDSKLGSYIQVNPDLYSPIYDDTVFELERILITRYRTGSNNLKIETGRFRCPVIPREQRLCSCEMDVQTLRHVLLECEEVRNMPNAERFIGTFTTVEEFFKLSNIHEHIMAISKTLKIEI